MGLKEIAKRLRNVSDKKVIHENDTIERFILPIIRVAEWDVDSINPLILRRGNQDRTSRHRRFDIELYSPLNDAPRFIFECKRLSDNILLEGKGDARNREDGSDFVRQLKNDCLSGNFCFKHDWTIPILTNGEKWVIFKTEFTNQYHANEAISASNYSNFIEVESSITDDDFEGKIIKVLKDQSAEQPHAQGCS